MKLKRYFFLILLSVCFFIGCDKPQNTISSVEPPNVETRTNISAKPETNDSAKANDLKKLKEWIGKYPIDPKNKNYQNFFQLPEVKQILVEILREEGFQNLLEHFSGTDLIKEKNGFLVMLGTTARNAAQDVDYALLALNPDTKETHIFFSDNKKLTAFSNVKGDGNLTAEIKQEILVHTDSAQTSVIGTLKQKPAEGFACYAVSPKDWDVIAEKRPYIFVLNDDTGIFNIEGRDVEIKQTDSNETKGENGKTYAEWNFADKNVKVKFDMVVSKLLNEGADVLYDGTLTVTSGAKTQTIQIKAFCGG